MKKRFWKLGGLVVLAGLPLAISAPARLINQQPEINLSKQNISQSRAREILTITNDTIDVNDPKLSQQFRDLFASQSVDHLQDLAFNKDRIQAILKELIQYGDLVPAITPIFKTAFKFSEFYYQFSQLQADHIDPNRAIVFSYDQQDPFSDLANGVLKIKIKIGKDLQNQFLFAGGKDEVQIKFVGLKKQLDLYMRDGISGQPFWDETNVIDDSVVKPYILKNKANTTLWRDVSAIKDPAQLIYDNLFLYDHRNGSAIQNQAGVDDYVLATNLTKADLKALNLITNIEIEPFFASGKIKISFDLGSNSLRDDKLINLNDKIGSWSTLKSDSAKRITIWLGGWKRDYSFAILQSTYQQSFDGAKIAIDQNQKLNEIDLEQLVNEIKRHNYEIIERALINFSDYLDPDGAHKLINTRLRYAEWKGLNGKINLNIKKIDWWNGELVLNVSFDPNLMTMHFNDALGKNFSQMKQFNFEVRFFNLQKVQVLKPRLTNINWLWLSKTTISDFFEIKNQQIDLAAISQIIKAKLIGYQQNRDDLVWITSALNQSELSGFNVTNFEADFLKGQVKIDWTYDIKAPARFNDQWYVQDQVYQGEPIIIKGFRAQPNQQFSFDLVKQNATLDINQFNGTSNEPMVNFAWQIDLNWVFKNLINFKGAPVKPNALFATDATFSEFFEFLLVNRGLALKVNSDQSRLDGVITLDHRYLKNQNQSHSDISFHFQIYNLQPIKTININDNFKIDLDLDDFNREYVMKHLISFSDRIVEKPLMVVNQSYQDWLTTSLIGFEIEKEYLHNRAFLHFKFRDFNDLDIEITGFRGVAKFKIYNRISSDQFHLAQIQNGNDLLNNLVNYNGQNQFSSVWLATNVSQQEFYQSYLKAITLIDRNFINNTIKFRVEIADPIKGLVNQDLVVAFNPNVINFYDFDKSYRVEQLALDKLWSHISFSDRVLDKAWFKTNLSQSQFQKMVQLSQVDQDLIIGTTSIKLTSQLSFDFDFSSFEQTSLINQNEVVLDLFSSKNQATFMIDWQIDGLLNDALRGITRFNDLNQAFVYNNLIGYQNQSQGFLGTTNLTKQQFIKMSDLVISNQGTFVLIRFNFASAINQGQNLWLETKITNLPFLKQAPSQYDVNLMTSAISFSLIGLIAISGGLIIWLKKRKQKRLLWVDNLNRNNTMQ